MKTLLKAVFLVSILLLSGCTKDDPNNLENQSNNLTGKFIDSFVSGLNYTTETKSGITDENGNFEYKEGETVTFSVGNIVLGSGPAKENMSPIDIASTANADINSAEVKNIAAFLQSLDSDNDPSNGIEINQTTVNAISVSGIDFTQPIEKILGEIIAEVNMATGSFLTVVYPEEAALHLAESLKLEYNAQNKTFINFTPTIEDWIPKPPTSIYWVHETNEEGNLIASVLYEKYPNRIVYEQTYEEYNTNRLPLSYKLDIYEAGSIKSTESVEVLYNEHSLVSGLKKLNPNKLRSENIRFNELDDQLKVIDVAVQIEENNFKTSYREVYTHLENKNRKTVSSYGFDESELKSLKTYTYTPAGDYDEAETQVYPQDYTITEIFIYRDDHTLESWASHNPAVSPNGRTEEIRYDEEEQRTWWFVITGDYMTEFFFDVDGEGTTVVESYYKGFLYEVITEYSDGSSIWKTINTHDGSYKLEYKDADSNITKTEYYDANGNLIS